MARRFVPFGSHWRMGIEVPYSLAVVDRGRVWSCGQCPLDLDAQVVHPGEVARQLDHVAGLIRAQFEPFGMTLDRIAKLVAYVAPDRSTPPESVEGLLREALGPGPLIVTVGVPPFYYPGMMVEIDVFGSDHGVRQSDGWSFDGGEAKLAAAGDGTIHLALGLAETADVAGLADRLERLLTGRGASLDGVVSSHVFVQRDGAARRQIASLATALGSDAGAAVMARLPHGQAAAVDLTVAPDAIGQRRRTIGSRDGIAFVLRQAGDVLGIAARCAEPRPSLAAATASIMEFMGRTLAERGFGFDSVVKQQTYYVGRASAQDLYENMRIRNSCYAPPGPASTGLAVDGFGDPDCRISVELLAVRRG